MAFEITPQGYQTLATEGNLSGDVFIYIGDNFVALSRAQAIKFTNALINVVAESGCDYFD